MITSSFGSPPSFLPSRIISCPLLLSFLVQFCIHTHLVSVTRKPFLLTDFNLDSGRTGSKIQDDQVSQQKPSTEATSFSTPRSELGRKRSVCLGFCLSFQTQETLEVIVITSKLLIVRAISPDILSKHQSHLLAMLEPRPITRKAKSEIPL